jgi:predicted YcjX-like family ATPase
LITYRDIVDGTRLAAGGLHDFATGLVNPTVRLGVTGLSRSGKTVFITALANALLKGARLPAFEAHARGRITRCYLEPQPDDDLPRFPYEENIRTLIETRAWPEGTRRISQLRITIEYEPQGFIARTLHSGKLHIDIVDYPGEWLLDLPLMRVSYAQWSAATMAAARRAPRDGLSKEFLAHASGLKPDAPASEAAARGAAQSFTAYLARCRENDVSLSTLPPGRFLMPGDLEGSPLLSFAPLDIAAGAAITAGSLAGLMARRYDSYVAKVVRPFFFGHFARLDRQIVLVDAMTALNAGPDAVSDLQQALADVLQSFRIGANSLASTLFSRRIDRILFAATKADFLNHHDHDRLESILREVVGNAATRADFAGAAYGVSAISAIRATREAKVTQKGEELLCIVGTPENGESIAGKHFDGETEAAIFPGDLPAETAAVWNGSLAGKLRFVRFRPPVMAEGQLPHIRLDRVMEFLLGDCFP